MAKFYQSLVRSHLLYLSSNMSSYNCKNIYAMQTW